ncbi:pentatricopeptide repeat-containing protein [Canna indica]|uniref:Pentatricopeptide repeat-containing protein n=1 Tax=Canna indica TaxID=4628 RepID=A0AAQ3PY19_9LILI|nr:pentatricopeptide repeat-containing protein [Canna indica]
MTTTVLHGSRGDLDLDHAHALFACSPAAPTTYMWNSMIRGLFVGPKPATTLAFYRDMLRYDRSPDHFTFPFAFKACSRVRDRASSCCIHGSVVRAGYETDAYVSSTLIHMYVSSTLIHMYVSCGDMPTTTALFERTVNCNIVTWMTMIVGYADHDQAGEANRLFGEMELEGVESNEITMKFLNAHRFFGVSNINKIIVNLDPYQRTEAMHTIIFHSDMHAHDPVDDCYHYIRELECQLEHDTAELELVLRQLAVSRAQAAAQHMTPWALSTMAPHDMDHQVNPNVLLNTAGANHAGNVIYDHGNGLFPSKNALDAGACSEAEVVGDHGVRVAGLGPNDLLRFLAVDDLASGDGTTKTYLGGPWKLYSRMVIMQLFIDSLIQSVGLAAVG